MTLRLIMWTSCCLALLGQGCAALGPKAAPPVQKLPEKLASAPLTSDLRITATLLELVRDSRARALVAEALENNHDIAATALRLKSSGLLLSQTDAARRPKLDGGYQGTRHNQSPTRAPQGSHRLFLAISWELDLWGKLADRHRAGEMNLEAEKKNYHLAMDALAARVLQTWFRARAGKMRLDIHDRRVRIYRDIENTVLARYRAGLGSLQDISTARAQTHRARAGRVQAQEEYAATVRDLELLLGRYPGNGLGIASTLPRVGLAAPRAPASILVHRPDVQAALQKARAALNHAKAGYKELLPSITLTGNLFRDNAVLARLGASGTGWNLAGDLLFPLFNAGRIRNQARAADETAQAAYREFAGVMLRAMKEAENTFARESRLKERLGFLEKAMANAKRSSAYYESRFKEGLATIMELHTAREQELDALQAILDVKADRIINRVDMALAVGTGIFERKKNED
ncbi:MAG: TolC family protein [Desulfobacter sp.]|nr:MAG: TolC family protein [Desulfobacter sp.]